MSDLHLDLPQVTSAPLSDPQEQPLAPLVLDGFLRREELAQQFGLNVRTIDRWEALRIGPPRACVGRTILYSIQSVREWLLSKERQAVPAKRRRPSGMRP
jgi:hypothetical protein